MGIRHSPRTAYSPWTNGLVEVQNRNLGTHLRMFLHDTPNDWAFQVHMYAYAHNSQPLSELNISPHEIVFHSRPRIPLTFDLNLNRDTSKTCISRYCPSYANILKPVHYLIKHEEILPHQKHDSHPILADYGTDQFSIRINDKGNDIVVKPLQSFSFKSITPFQTKFKTPIKKNNKTLHQQSLLLNDTDVTSDDEDHIYTRIPKSDSSFLHDTTVLTDYYSTLNQLTHTTSQKSVSAITVQPNLPSLTHCVNKLYLSMIHHFSSIKTIFKVSSSQMITH